RLMAAAAAVAGVAVLDLVASRRLSAAGVAAGARRGRALQATRTITIGRPAEEVYRFWRDLENLPRFMSHLDSVRVLDQRRSHWVARAPAGRTVEWDAEIVEDRAGELIAWRSLEGADVPNSGSVRFTPAPGGRGTEVRVQLQYQPPGGAVGAAVAKLFGEEPGQQVASDLRRLKQVIETGEVVKSDASIHRLPHPARPPATPL
ncbi:MAG TPA: SRPBCC family protein, partial [Gemmatimonadales bacterium]|nr:SRPBCC family protein [Gemmatimonadales bacterium]